jgi:hypothetical protein
MKTDLQIHERGLETVAIWQQYKPNFTVGTITLSTHTADTALLDEHMMQKISAANAWTLAREARNSAAEEINAICARVCGTVESTLADNDSLIKLVRAVRAVKNRSYEAVGKRANETIDLWKALNTHRAAMTPAQPALLIDEMTVQAFQSTKGNYLQLLANVKSKDVAHDGKLKQLRSTVKRVDRQNKRWFKAWRAHFGAGTTERGALDRVSTEGGSTSLPGQGVFLSHEVLADQRVRFAFGAARATSFTLLHKGPSSPAFSVLADGLSLKSFEHATGEVGEHQYKLVPHNSAGDGTESLVLKVQVAQQAAA